MAKMSKNNKEGGYFISSLKISPLYTLSKFIKMNSTNLDFVAPIRNSPMENKIPLGGEGE